jgi:hypothetical protein
MCREGLAAREEGKRGANMMEFTRTIAILSSYFVKAITSVE